jgi:pectate lyase
MKILYSYIILLVTITIFFPACHAQKQATKQDATNEVIAFPGAEGFGKYTTGGRGGKIIIVTNLNDKGPGSFREAAETNGKRFIVFSVSGTIHLETKLGIKGDATIAGQTAPGDGICLADQPVSLGGDNIIVRYLRFRMGDKYQRGGMVDGNGGDDAFGGLRRKNIIVDHCSMSWSTDEVFSVYMGDSTTLQWNLISEPLNYSYHFETGDKDYEHHGYGASWGGNHLSAHHNLFAHCNNRNPRFNGIRNTPEENVDYCNNVIYNWGGNNIYAGEGGNYNLVNNYFKYGPSTNTNVRYRIVNPGNLLPKIPFGKYYVNGNYVDGAEDVTKNNWLGIHMGNNGTAEDKRNAVVSQPHPSVEIPVESATQAYESVLAGTGASFRRDTLDQRIINDVKNRTGKLIDVQGDFPHGTPYELTVTAWPALTSIPSLPDQDKDGMPDEWEKKNGLDANDPSDAASYKLDKAYTNIEVYINQLVPVKKK